MTIGPGENGVRQECFGPKKLVYYPSDMTLREEVRRVEERVSVRLHFV